MDTACVVQNKGNVEYKIVLADEDTLECHITQHTADSKQSPESDGAKVSQNAPALAKMTSKIPSPSRIPAAGSGSKIAAPPRRRKLPAPPPPITNGDLNDGDVKIPRASVYVVDSGHSSDASTASNQVESSHNETASDTQSGLSPRDDRVPPPRPPKPQCSPRETKPESKLSKPSVVGLARGIPTPRQSNGIPQFSGKRPTVNRPRSVDVSLLGGNKLTVHVSSEHASDSGFRRRALSSERTPGIPRPMTFVPDTNSKLTSPVRKIPERKLSAGSRTPTYGSKSSLVETIRSGVYADKDDEEAPVTSLNTSANNEANNSENVAKNTSSTELDASLEVAEISRTREPPKRPSKPPDVLKRAKSPGASSLTLSIYTVGSADSAHSEREPLNVAVEDRPSFLSRYSLNPSPSRDSGLTAIPAKSGLAPRERVSRVAKYTSPKTSPRDETGTVKSGLKSISGSKDAISHLNKNTSPKTSPREGTESKKIPVRSASKERKQHLANKTSPKISPREDANAKSVVLRSASKERMSTLSKYTSPKSSPREENEVDKTPPVKSKPATKEKPRYLSKFSPKKSPRDESITNVSETSQSGTKDKPSSYLSRYMYTSPKRSSREGDEKTAKRPAPQVPSQPSPSDASQVKRPSSLAVKPAIPRRDRSIPRPGSVVQGFASDKPDRDQSYKSAPPRPSAPPMRGRTARRNGADCTGENTHLKPPENDDSGINSSKDSDLPMAHLSGSYPGSPGQGDPAQYPAGFETKPPRPPMPPLPLQDNVSEAEQNDTYNVVRCADSLLSVYEIQEDEGNGGDLKINPYAVSAPSKERHSYRSVDTKEDSLATTTLCSSEKEDENNYGAVSSLVSRISTARHSPLYHGTETDRDTPTPKAPFCSGLKRPSRLPQERRISEGSAAPHQNHEKQEVSLERQRHSWGEGIGSFSENKPSSTSTHLETAPKSDSSLVKQSFGAESQLHPGLCDKARSEVGSAHRPTNLPSRVSNYRSTVSPTHSPAREGSSPARGMVRNSGLRSPVSQSERPAWLNRMHRSPSTSPNRLNQVRSSPSKDIVVVANSPTPREAQQPHYSANSSKSVSYISAQITSQEQCEVAVTRTITVQTSSKSQSNDATSNKPPSPQLSLLKRPNSPRTMSPLLVVKPNLIRRSSFTRDRKPPESPRSRSPVLGHPEDIKSLSMTYPGPGDRGSYSSLGSDIIEQEIKQGRGSKPSYLFTNKNSSVPEMESPVPSSPINSDLSPSKFYPRSSPVLAFPSALGKEQPINNESEIEEPPPALPPKGVSPRASPVDPHSSAASPAIREFNDEPPLPPPRESSPKREGTPSRLVSPRKLAPPGHIRDNSPLSLLLTNNRKMQEASSLMSEPKLTLGETYPPKYTSSIARISRSRDSSPISSDSLNKCAFDDIVSSSTASTNDAPPVPRPRSTPAKISYVEKEAKKERPKFSGIPVKGKIGTVVKRDGSPIQARGASPQTEKSTSSPLKLITRQGSPLGKPPRAQRTPSPDTAKNELAIRNRFFRSDHHAVATDSCDSQSESYATLGDVASLPRKKSGILKQCSDESDASEYTATADKDSPSKKRVTFDRLILEKEEQKAIRELRDQRRQEDLAKYMKKRMSHEKSKTSAVTRSVSWDSGSQDREAIEISQEGEVETGEGGTSGTGLRKKYKTLTDDQIQNLHKYLLNSAKSRKKDGQNRSSMEKGVTVPRPKVIGLKHSNSDTELPLYSKVMKKEKTVQISQESPENVSNTQDLVNSEQKEESHPDNVTQSEDEYVTLSDLKIVLKCGNISKDLVQNRSDLEMEEREFDAIDSGTDLGDVSITLVDKETENVEADNGSLQDDEANHANQGHSGTSRPPRHGENNGVDYTFVTVEEFSALEKSGNLLESGMYDGHHYGTPKPPKDPQSNLQRSNSMGTSLAGQHPSSEGKRKRNRSIGESMLNKGSPPLDDNAQRGMVRSKSIERTAGSPSPNHGPVNPQTPDLGPLPPNWEMAYTEDGTPYFIDHNSGRTQWQDPRYSAQHRGHLRIQSSARLNNGLTSRTTTGLTSQPHTNSSAFRNSHSSETTHWLDPRLAKNQKMSPLECAENELPYGWEKVEDPHYGTYFIDHVNRKTQYENPVLQAKRQASEAYVPPSRPVFTKNPDQLRGEFIKTQLDKSPRGFGFTILGGNDVDEEFLQIKNVVPGGPAASDAKLRTGDVLVYVNGQCVLGYTHQDVVSIFQKIAIGQKVTLEVCRGYPLPFDPDDPNTEIVTRMAVTLPQDSRVNNSPPEYSRGNQTHPHMHTNNDRMSQVRSSRPELLTMKIVKGEMGFGFTIADSAYGQKVRQILDRDRCRTLNEGDILVEINEHKVKDMPHSDVVKVLKDCVQNAESRIVIQRGGMLSSNQANTKHKHNRANEDRRKVAESSLMPNSYTNADDGDGGSLQEEGIDTRFLYPRLNDSHDSRDASRDHNAPDLVNSSQHRSRTPNADFERNRSRSPADMLGQEGGKYSRQYGASQRRDFNSQDYSVQAYNRNDLSSRSFSQHDRQGQGEPPSRYRSRTPGPDFMRSRERDDEQYFSSRGRDTARSKTPTSELFKQQSSLSGTPDFIPASRYQSPPRGHPGYGHQDRGNYSARPGGQRPGTDFAQHSDSRIPTSQSYSSALSKGYSKQSAAFGAEPIRSSARKQSTSFEYVEPRPSNLTRIPYMERIDSQNEALSRSRSPFDDDRFVEMTVQLQRQESGFGFRIIGGTEEGSQVSVGHIVPGGAADMDGQLRVGDEIMMVDSESVLGVSHRKVVQLMGQAGMCGQVRLVIRRRLAHVNDPSPHAHSYPYDVTVTRRENEGFGFVIISSVTRAGSVIGRIIENSPATRCGRLHVGDLILAVNATNIMHMHHEDIVNLIKDSGYSVTLTVGPPQAREPVYQALLTMAEQAQYESSGTASHGSQRAVGSSQGSMINAMAYPAHSESDISRRSDYSPHHFPGTPPQQMAGDKYQQQILEKHRELARQRTQSPSQASPSSVEEDKVYRIELHRGSRGFGFSIRGGREFNNMPLYVLKIAPGGAAALDQRLKVGDEIVEINGYQTTNMTHSDAIELIQEHGSTVTLFVKRTGKMPAHLVQGGHMGSHLPVHSQSNTPTLALPNGPTQGPLSQSSPNPNRRPPDTNYYHSNFPRY